MPASKVAVVVTCYNLGRTVEDAVASVRAQVLPVAELVIVDDGSTDLFTRQALGRLAREGERIVRTENRGLSAARNFGARLTVAPYLVFLDADDKLDPAYLEKACARLDADPGIGFVSCAAHSFGAAELIWRPREPTLVGTLAGGAVHPSSLVRRELWERIGGFDERIGCYGDLDFWTRALELGFTGIVLDEPLFHYRVRADSMYHAAIDRSEHEFLMDEIFAKHWKTVERHGEEILREKERFILDQREHQRHLVHEQAGLERELDRLRRETESVVEELRELGLDRVSWGELRRTTPLSPVWGLDWGRPLDRYYIEGFLARHREDIRGHVLEVKDSGYTRLFGGDRVTASEVLDIDPANDQATITADLARAATVASDSFDCFILTQTLGLIYDVRAAIAESFRILKPAGVLLCTVPAAGRISYEDRALDGDYWRFTEASLRELFAEAFPIESFEVTGYGNVLACTAFLYGLAIHELTPAELDACDPYFPLIYGVRAVKPSRAPGEAVSADLPGSKVAHPGPGSAEAGALILTYHRVAEPGIDPHHLCVAPEVFRLHMEAIRDLARLIPLPDLVRAVEDGEIPRRAVAVTLDDGYADSLAASEILLATGVPATFFVTELGLDAEHELWWDTLVRVFLGPEALPVELDLEVGGERLTLPTASAAQRRVAHDLLWERVAPLPLARREQAIKEVLAWAGLPPAPVGSQRPMTASELRQLAARPGHTIGAHTASHLRLDAQPLEVRRREIAGHKSRLEALLGREVSLFAFPFGIHDRVSVALVRRARFRAGLTGDPGVIRRESELMRLPRNDVCGRSADELAAEIERLFRGASSNHGSS